MGKKERDRVLNLREIRSGYLAAVKQAESLISEARLLIDNGRHAGGYHRLVIGLEELGKSRMFTYQGAFALDGKNVSWTHFWKDYYSHVPKLREALVWSDTLTLVPTASSGKEIELAFDSAIHRAKDLDGLKQATSYSDVGVDGFSAPKDSDFVDEAATLRTVADALLARAIEHDLTKCPDDNSFGEILVAMLRYTRALGFLDVASREVAYDQFVDGNQPFWTRGAEIPSDEAFMARVEERYAVLPSRLQVTLGELSKSAEFTDFYQSIKTTFGYPDWLLLGTIFNIVLNARVDTDEYIRTERIHELLEWGEDPEVDKPLPIGMFIDHDVFDRMLGMWLTSFLVGLGVMPQEAGSYGTRVRRFAARHFGLYNRDVKHAAIFSAPTKN